MHEGRSTFKSYIEYDFFWIVFFFSLCKRKREYIACTPRTNHNNRLDLPLNIRNDGGLKSNSFHSANIPVGGKLYILPHRRMLCGMEKMSVSFWNRYCLVQKHSSLPLWAAGNDSRFDYMHHFWWTESRVTKTDFTIVIKPNQRYPIINNNV